jgi:hypothetical protein
VGVVIIIAGVGLFLNARRDDNGQISNAGTLQVGDLRVGDCFDQGTADGEEFDSVDAKPCGEAHRYEMFHVGAMPTGSYPSDDAMTAWVGANCLPAFEAYVAASIETTALDFTWYTPTEASWNDGDNTVLCAVFDPNQPSVTGSLKGSGR